MPSTVPAPDPTTPPRPSGMRRGSRSVLRVAPRRASGRRVALAQFFLSTAVLLAVVATAGAIGLRHVATGEALHDARSLTVALGQAAIRPDLTPAVLEGDPAALRRLDADMRLRVLHGPIVRIKVWRPDGRVVYSDLPQLVGRRFPPSEDLRVALQHNAVRAEVTDLSAPENRFERGRGRLVEVYQPLTTDDGRRVVVEAYHRASAISAGSRRILRVFLPIVIALLLALALAQLPLAWFLARRVRAEEQEREALGRRADAALDAERRRIAAELHDGVVQDLAGVAYDLQAVSARMPDAGADDAGSAMRRGAAVCRESIRALRTLLVDLYPSQPRARALEHALEELAEPLRARGVTVAVDLEVDPADLEGDTAELVYRAAQEALRNVDRHAAARSVQVTLQPDGHDVRLVVRDDGRGMSAAALRTRHEEGHMGLALLAGSVSARGGTLTIESEPRSGTRVVVVLPRHAAAN